MPFNPETNTLTSIAVFDPRSGHFKKERRDALLEQLRNHHEEAEAARGDWPTRHERRYRRFLADQSLRGQGPWRNAPRIFTPDTQSVVETIWSQLWTGVFPRFEAIEVEPFDETALPHVEKALQTERWCLRYLINDADAGGFAHICRMALFDALIDSAGFLKVYPWRQPWRDAVPERLIRMDNVDEGTLLIPPGARSLQYPDAEYVGQEVWARWDDLLRLKHEGFYVPAKDKMVLAPKHLTERQRIEVEREGRTTGAPKQEYPVVEMYERFVVDPKVDEEEDDLIVSWYPDNEDDEAIGRVVYVQDRFPQPDHVARRPFFPLVVWQQPRQLRGQNLPDKIEIYQDLVNRLTEQMVWYGDVSILPFFVYSAMVTGDLPDLTQIMPGQGVPVLDMNGIQFVPRGSMNRHFQEQFNHFTAQIEKASHVSDFTSGRSPTRPNAPRTASGTAMILQQGREAFSTLVHVLGYQWQAPLQFHWQLQQHYAPPGLKVPLKRVARGRGADFATAQTPGALSAPESLLPPQGMLPPGGGTSLAGLVPGLSGQGNGAHAPESPFAFPGRALAPADQASDELLHPEEAYWVAEEVSDKDLQGLFLVKLKVNPDLPFDRQIILQLGQFMFPIIKAVYPLGARRLLKRMWEIHNQSSFDEYYPESVAMLETQRLFSQVIQQAQMQMAQQQAQQQGQGQTPQQGPSRAALAAQDAHAQSAARHGMRQHEEQTTQEQLQTMQEQAKLLAQIQELLGTGEPSAGD